MTPRAHPTPSDQSHGLHWLAANTLAANEGNVLAANEVKSITCANVLAATPEGAPPGLEIHGVSNSHSQKEPAVEVAEAAEAAAAESEPDDSAESWFAMEPAATDEAAADDPAVAADEAAALVEPPEELALGPEPFTTL